MNRTRALTEGAVIVALYIILLLATFYLPILGTVLLVTLSIPFIVYTYRHMASQALIVFISSLLLTYLTLGIFAVPLTFMFGSAGIVMGYFYKKNSSAFTILITGSLAFIANVLLLYGASILIFQIDFIAEAKAMFEQSISMAERLLPEGEEANSQLQLLYEQLEVLQYILPSGMIFIGVILSLLSQMIANIVLKRLKGNIQTFPPFKDWNFPQSLLWYYLGAMILTFFNLEQGTTIYIAVINAFVVLEMVMVIQGLSFLFYFSHMKKWNKSIPIIATILVFFIPIFLHIVRILGIIDLGFRLKQKLKQT